MYKVNLDWKKLRAGEKVKCPECKNGIIKTKYDSKTSHHFKCDKCGMQINTKEIVINVDPRAESVNPESAGSF